MKKLARILLFFLVLMITLPVTPLSTSAEASNNYFQVTQNKSYTEKGNYFLSFTMRSFNGSPKFAVTAQLLNPSGGVVHSYNGFILNPGTSKMWRFGYNYSNLPSGTYTLKVTLRDYSNPMDIFADQWSSSYRIKHTAPPPSFSYKSYETYFNKSGMLMHKVNIQCSNMKGKKLYCKIYDSYGYLVCDFGKDTVLRKTNNETGFFAWNGYQGGQKCPSGDYTFVITSSANQKVLQKTLHLNILEVGNQ